VCCWSSTVWLSAARVCYPSVNEPFRLLVRVGGTLCHNQGRRSRGLGVLTPWKYVGAGQSMFWPPPPLKKSHSFIQKYCWITLQVFNVSHHQERKTCIKWNFSRRIQASQEPALLRKITEP